MLDPLQMLPAPGQGALAVECRADDDLVAALAALDDRGSRAAVEAERAVLATLEGGCSAPIGALAEVAEGEDGDELWVRAVALSRDGALSVRMSATGDPTTPPGVGARLAKEMLADGAGDLDDRRTRSTHDQQRQTRCTTHDARQDHHHHRPRERRHLGRARGWVSFVGSGPGDPDLLTVRAVTLLEQADVVVTESPEHVDLVRRLLALPAECETPLFVDGGFGEDGQPLTHAARAKVVVRHAKKGQRVVRLMTGDPFLYASGPEEAQACVKAGLGFEIVPGVSSVVRGPGLRRHPADHQGPPRGRGRHRAREGRLGGVRRRPHAGAALRREHGRRHRQGARRRRPRPARPRSR